MNEKNTSSQITSFLKVYISVNTLEDIVKRAISENSRTSYTVPLGLLSGLLVSLFTSDFKDYSPYISKNRLEDIFYFLTFSCAVWFLIAFLRDVVLHRPITVKEAINEVIQKSENMFKRMILFLVTANITYQAENITTMKILFRYDPGWDMWVLPNYKTLITNIEELQSIVLKLFENEFSINFETVKARNCPNLNMDEEKMSPETEKLTIYQFNVFHIQMSDLKQEHVICNEEFTITGVKYRWFTVNEVMQHTRTFLLNRKVILQLKEELSFIVSALPISCAFTVKAPTSLLSNKG